jgi:hypothetical protein
MKPLAPRLAILGAVSVSVLLAGAFWEETAPEDWSQAQIEELLSDSPWAKPADVRFTGDRGGSRLPGGVGLPGGRGRTGGGTRIPRTSPWPGAGGGIGFPYVAHARESAFDAEATIVWTSSLPVRQALERLGEKDELRNVQAADFYVVTIDGLPPAMAPLADTPDVFRQSARIERKDGSFIHAKRVEVRPRPGAPGIELYFPRDARLSTDEKTIEVVVNAGDYIIRRKFKPAEMVYRGRLEM